MKNIFTLAFVLAGFISSAQKHFTAKDLFSEQSIVWFGIDYSKAKFIGSFAQFKDAGEVDGNKLVNSYFSGWNNVILREPKKYDIAKFFNKASAPSDLSSVTKVNSATKPQGIMQENDYELSEKEIPRMVAKYKSAQYKQGLGVVFITESYNHSKEFGSYYVVIFDIASKKVLISEKISAKPGGIGLKNYWISTAFKTLEEISDNTYAKWQKTYGK